MSYDIGMSADLGGPEKVSVWDGCNYTSNVGPMWCKAYLAVGGVEKGNEYGIRWIDGKTGAECLSRLEAMACWMADHAADLIPLNPPNGWGNYEGAIGIVRELVAAAKRAPKGVFWIWC